MWRDVGFSEFAFSWGQYPVLPVGSKAQDILVEWMNIFVQGLPHPNSGCVPPLSDYI